jgi:hypothetical protein
MAEGMNARVHNKLIHFVLWTKGDNIIRIELIEFAIESESRIRKTFFKHKDIHKFTWSTRNCSQ